jgi:hypothetical protein
MGLKRIRSFHFKQQVAFPWKRHVLFGRITFSLLLTGMVVGLTMVRLFWDNNFMTLGHGKMAMVTLPFILFGFFSGELLNRKVSQQAVLRILHGGNNVVVLILLLNQARLGIEVYQLYVAGL